MDHATTCQQCGAAFIAHRRDGKYCSAKCGAKAHRDSRTRTCSTPECDRPVRASELCAHHYRAMRGRIRQDEYFDRTCVVCAATFRSARATGKYCSDTCKGVDYSQRRTTRCPLPVDHPVRQLIAEGKRAAREGRLAVVLAVRQQRLCEWRTPRECPGCACWFSPLHTPNMLTCSNRCARRVGRRRRRAREAGAYGSWVWSDFMRVARRFGYTCAYCGAKPGTLEPDHVVPLSRGGYDAVTNLLPSCRACNGDKRNLLLDEWALDRDARNKPARTTSWPAEDKRYWHLTQHVAVAAA